MNNIILSHSAKSLSNTFGFYDQLDTGDLIERAHRMDWSFHYLMKWIIIFLL